MAILPLLLIQEEQLSVNDESFLKACFLILYFHACACIYGIYMNKVVSKPMTKESTLSSGKLPLGGLFKNIVVRITDLT